MWIPMGGEHREGRETMVHSRGDEAYGQCIRLWIVSWRRHSMTWHDA